MFPLAKVTEKPLVTTPATASVVVLALPCPCYRGSNKKFLKIISILFEPINSSGATSKSNMALKQIGLRYIVMTDAKVKDAATLQHIL